MAVLSKVVIGNMALSNLGAKANIESFTENSAEARAINLWYNQSRQEILEQHDWSFAMRRLTLTSHSDVPPDGVWAYRYQYPNDCLRARELVNTTTVHEAIVRGVPVSYVQPDAIPYSIEISTDGTLSILTDLSNAILRYTFDQENPTLYPRRFTRALAYLLSYHIAIALTGRTDLKDKMYALYSQHIDMAAADDANQDVERAPRDAIWIRGRG